MYKQANIFLAFNNIKQIIKIQVGKKAMFRHKKDKPVVCLHGLYELWTGV